MEATRYEQGNIPQSFWDAVSAVAGDGEPQAACRRDGASVMLVTFDNRLSERYNLPAGTWKVVYAMYEDGEIAVEAAFKV